MPNLSVKFDITIHQERSYTYETMGQGSASIVIPEEIIRSIEPGNVFALVLESALTDMYAKILKKEEEENKEKES